MQLSYDDIVIDNNNKPVTTTAYMLAENITQTASSIRKPVQQMVSLDYNLSQVYFSPLKIRLVLLYIILKIVINN